MSGTESDENADNRVLPVMHLCFCLNQDCERNCTIDVICNLIEEHLHRVIVLKPFTDSYDDQQRVADIIQFERQGGTNFYMRNASLDSSAHVKFIWFSVRRAYTYNHYIYYSLKVKFESDKNILQAVRDQGIDLPTTGDIFFDVLTCPSFDYKTILHNLLNFVQHEKKRCKFLKKYAADFLEDNDERMTRLYQTSDNLWDMLDWKDPVTERIFYGHDYLLALNDVWGGKIEVFGDEAIKAMENLYDHYRLIEKFALYALINLDKIDEIPHLYHPRNFFKIFEKD
ncbi:unnamed protein product [Caenorhabditis bovis]|uniref:Uncharacterized protein n=1 Tax=Caenorhabditis bovis TaxID=2654633 RepID=A0A8S1EL95_9PELO|nr:unnamed protein product [Caenorhabditis bovis]